MEQLKDNLVYLRPRKREAFRRLKGALVHKPQLKIEQARDVVLVPSGQIPAPFPESAGKYIVDDNDYVAEMFPRESVSADMRLRGKTLYGGWLRKIWGHFLMGGLARMWAATVPDFLDGIDNVLFFSNDFTDGQLQGNYLEIMQLLGVADKMVVCRCNVEVEHLFVPEISFEHDRFNSAECKATFGLIRSRAMDGAAESRREKTRKLFLTRSLLKDAGIDEVNLDKVERMFADNGFEIVAPERLSVSGLVRMFSEASEIASVSGSTAHNFVFAPDGNDTRFIIMERHAMPNTFQINIDDFKGIYPLYVDASYMPVFSSSQDRPVLFAMTQELQSFVSDMGWDSRAFGNGSNGSRRRELRRYLMRHRRYFGNAESMEPWEIDCAPVLAEAVLVTREHYARWLVQLRPLLWYDFLTPRFYLRALKTRFPNIC